MKKLTQLTFVFSLLVFAQTCYGQTILSGGDLSGVITKDKSPYRVTGDIRIPKDSTLVIEAGVYLDFDSAKVVRIDGTLKALGTENNPITMTCSDSLLGWLGLMFVDTKGQDTSFLNYTKIEYIGIPRSILQSPYFPDAKHSNNKRYAPSAILAYSSAPIRVTYCQFRRNWRLIEADSAYIEMNNTDFFENLLEFGLYPNGHGGAIIQSHFTCLNSHFYKNNTVGFGIGDNLKVDNPGEIRNCIFENGWFPLNFGTTDFNITNCDWNSIRCKAIQIGDGSAVTIDSCSFGKSSENCFGGHIEVNGNASETIIKNCKFSNSESFRGAVFVEGSPPTFINCQFSKNNQGILHNDSPNPLNIINCVFDKNVKAIMGNKPMFILNSIFINNKMDTVPFKINSNDTAFLRSSSAIHFAGSKLKVYNSVFWNNQNYLGEKLNITVENNLSSVDVYNSIFPEGKQSIYSPTIEKPFTGTFSNCITTAPLLKDTASGDYRMRLPCSNFPSGFNKGYTGAISMQYKGKTYSDILSVLKTDLDGNSRIYDDTTDIGPYEIQALGNRIDIIDSLKDQVICQGKDGAFWATANTVGLIYEWQTSHDGSDWKFYNNKAEPIVISNAAKSDSGKYYRIKWANSCGIRKTTSPAQLIVPTAETLEISTDKDTINQITQTTLTATDGFRSYQWSSGSNAQTTIIQGKDLGLGAHMIYLTAMDSNGCEVEDSVEVTVVDKSSIGVVAGNQVKVYPNPASNFVELIPKQRGEFTIVSVTGKVLFSGQIIKDRIDISDLAVDAFYILVVEHEDKRYYSRFFKVN